jgi:hypothetical protein
MKKDFKIIRITVIACTLFLIIFSAFLFDYFPRNEASEGTYVFRFTLNTTMTNESYEIDNISIGEKALPTENLQWWLIDKNNTVFAQDNFPMIGGEPETTEMANVTVTWFDNDENDKLSGIDTIKIIGNITELKGYSFIIIDTTNSRNEIVFETVLD